MFLPLPPLFKFLNVAIFYSFWLAVSFFSRHNIYEVYPVSIPDPSQILPFIVGMPTLLLRLR